MPVDFLTVEQERRYGRYAGEPTVEQLDRFFHLDDRDRELVAARRGDHNRLGFALQLTTVRFLGTFLANPLAVPPGVIAYLAGQLYLSDASALARYGRRVTTQWEHAAEIKHRYGYQDFTAQPAHFHLVRWLFTRAWLNAERPSILFDRTTARLVECKILLPGVTTLARLIAQARDRAARRLWRTLALVPTPAQRARLLALLETPAGSAHSRLEGLRRPPTQISAPALVSALQRLDTIRALDIGALNLARIPPGQLTVLARYAATAWAGSFAHLSPERQVATLLAFAHVFAARAQDDALDLLDQLLDRTFHRASQREDAARLRTLRDLDSAALHLRAAALVLLDPPVDLPTLLASVFIQVPREQLLAAAETVARLARAPTRPPYVHLEHHYAHIRQFLPALLHTVTFDSIPAGRPVLDAWQFLQSIEGQRRPSLQGAPREVVPRAWRGAVFPARRRVNRAYYTFCVLEQLQQRLRRRDVFVAPSERWGDPRTKLLQGATWTALRPQVCRALGRDPTPAGELARLAGQLDAAYRQVAAHLPTNAAVRIERAKGRDTLVLTGLDKLEEPPSLVSLREQVEARLPRVDLPDALLEVEAQTGFAQEFIHISQTEARVVDLPLSICAVLLAEACNIGLEPLVRPDHPALTRGRLAWVQQNYIRAETLRRANARLVDAQAAIPLAQVWGGGEVASADGLRFVVPVHTLNARPNSKYFKGERGVTYFNFTSDQFSGFHGIVIPGTLRDSLYILEGLLEQQTSIRPLEVMTDTASYSDVVFGLFWLLGYQFSPRLADIGEARFWRIDPAADYGPLHQIARQRIKTELIARHWDDLLRVAG